MKNKGIIKNIRNSAIGVGLFASSVFGLSALDQEQINTVMNPNPIVQEYIENEDMAPTNEVGAALEPYISALAQKHEIEYTADGAYNTQDHAVLREQIAPLEEQLQGFEGGLSRPEISTLQNLAKEYVQTLDSQDAPEEQLEIPGTQARREVQPEDKWNAVLNAQSIDEVVNVVGGGAVALAQIQDAERSRLTSSQFEEVSQRIYSAAVYSILNNAAKGLEGYTPENAAMWIGNIGVSYLESIGEDEAARGYLGDLSRDAHFKLSNALELGSSEIAKLSGNLFGNYQNENLPENAVKRIQDLDALLSRVNNTNQASNYMNSDWSVRLTQPFRTTQANTGSFHVDTVSNGDFYGEFNEFTNYPGIEATIANLIRVNLAYSGKTGQVSFQETGEASPSLIENYSVNQSNLELSGLVNVLSFMEESNKFNLGLWLGAGYRQRAFTQEFNGEVIPRSENIENSFGLNAEFESLYNTSTGTLLGLDAFIKTGLSTYQDQTNVTGGVDLSLRQFFDGFYMGLNAGIVGSNEPTDYDVNPSVGLNLGTRVGESHVGLTGTYSRNGLELGLDFKY